jgi:hypothetical protein
VSITHLWAVAVRDGSVFAEVGRGAAFHVDECDLVTVRHPSDEIGRACASDVLEDAETAPHEISGDDQLGSFTKGRAIDSGYRGELDATRTSTAAVL